MVKFIAAAVFLLPCASGAVAQAIPPGKWDVTSTVVDISVPGVPGFLVRTMKGKSKAEHKVLAAGQTMEALLAPDPKAKCRIDSQRIADGQYAQTLSCPQKRGEPMRITRTGTYDRTGFTGRASVNGTRPKGQMSIVLDQRAARVGD